MKATLLDRKGNSLGPKTLRQDFARAPPKQVSPFRIDFHNVRMSQVDSVRMQPSSNLVPASADPVIGIESQKLNPLPDASLTGHSSIRVGKLSTSLT